MSDWLRPFLMMFYAPARGMSEVRDGRAPLGLAALLALLTQALYTLYVQWPYLAGSLRAASHGAFASLGILLSSAGSLLFMALVFVPAIIFVANLFERRASFKLALQQEYTATAATIFYASAAASVAALPLAFLVRASGAEAAWIEQSLATAAQWQREVPEALLADPRIHLESIALLLRFPFLTLFTIVAVREVFRLSWLRAAAVLLAGGAIMFITSPLWSLFSVVFASPFLLLLLFFLLRGYISEFTRTQRARASFRQNLEAATLNPADASAHYNLGLIHLQRKELNEARARFERAVEIDAEEVDAHYQLGHIGREQNRLSEAIQHFEQVVVRDAQHAQHEIWREIGATYLVAGQFDDAREALERFLGVRQSDPEGLYLMGRALSGLGRPREAAESMQACIEAVKTAPAYKYRAEKRWLNEAQQFLRSQA